MDLGEFAELHVPALEADEVRFNLQIAAIASAVKERPVGFRHWTLGGPGHCAIQWPGRAIVLGNLDRTECRELARATERIEYPGVVGADETARWLVEHAAAMGADFEDPIPQRIHVLSSLPHYPGVPGSARAVRDADAPLLFEWLVAFHEQAVPHDPPPEKANAERAGPAGVLYSGRPTRSPSPLLPLHAVCGIRELSLPFTPRPRNAAADMRAPSRPQWSISSRRGQDCGLPLYGSAQSHIKSLLRQDRLQAPLQLLALPAQVRARVRALIVPRQLGDGSVSTFRIRH